MDAVISFLNTSFRTIVIRPSIFVPNDLTLSTVIPSLADTDGVKYSPSMWQWVGVCKRRIMFDQKQFLTRVVKNFGHFAFVKRRPENSTY